MNVLGAVLAGGRATRMGGANKALAELAGRPLLDHVMVRLQPQLAAVIINSNADPAQFAGFGLQVVADGDHADSGPLAGLLAVMDHAAAQGFSHVLTVPCDTPFLPHDLLQRLQAAATGGSIAMAASGTTADARQPACALWPVALRGRLRDALAAGSRKVTGWADAQGCVQVRFPPGEPDPFFNINSAEDLAIAEAIMRMGP